MSIIQEIYRDQQSEAQRQEASEAWRQAETSEAYRVLVYQIVEGQAVGKADVLRVLQSADKSVETLDADVQTVTRVKRASQAWANRAEIDQRIGAATSKRDDRRAEVDADLQRRRQELAELEAEYQAELSKLDTAKREAESAKRAMRAEITAVLSEYGETIDSPADLLEQIERAQRAVWEHSPKNQQLPTHDLPALPPDEDRQRHEAELRFAEAEFEQVETAYDELSRNGRATGELRSRVEGLKLKVMRARSNLGPWLRRERHAEEQARRDATYPELHRQWKAHLEQLEALVPDWRALTFD